MVKRPARLKTIKRLGTPLPGLTRKEAPPEVPRRRGTGTPRRRQRKSAYRQRLEEKQKLRFNYGITEGQLRRVFEQARRRRGPTGHELLALLERRLDNVVFRLGFAPTIPAARQLVVHGHVLVDGKRVDVPGQLVKPQQVIAIAPRAREIPGVVESVRNGPQVRLPSYLARNPDNPFEGYVTGEPGREDVPFPVDDTAIVEFYAR
jgi:small subunit ribosomal protein S4